MPEGKLEIAVQLSAIDRMTAVITKATAVATGKLDAFAKKANAISERAATVGRNAAIGAAALAAPLVYATQKAIEFEGKMADVAKVANLDMASNEFKKISHDVTNLSKYLATSANDVGVLYSSLISGGTAKDQLQKVAKIAGEAAVAFDMTQEAAGSAYSTMRNAMGLTINDTKTAFDQVNALTNKFGRKGSELLEFMSGGGASTARALKISSGDMLAFGQTMIASGTSASETGTVVEALTRTLNKNKAAMQIFKEGGGGGKGLLHMMEVAKASGNSMEWFMRHGFDRQSSKFSLLSENSKQLGAAMQYIGKQSNFANSATQEFNNRMNTTGMKLKQAKIGFDNAAISAGNAFLPVVTKLLTSVTPLIEKLGKWIDEHQELTGTIMNITAVVAVFLGAVSGISFAVSGVMKVISAGSSILSFATSAWGMISKAVLAFNAVLMANPIILIVTAIVVAVAGIAYLIYKYWDQIKAFFIKTWANIKAIFWKVVAWVKEWGILFLGPVGFIIKYWDRIVVFFKTMPAKMFEAGKNIVKSIWDGIKFFANKPVEAIRNIVQKIRNLLPKSPAKEGPLRDIHRIRLIETIADTMKPAPMIKAMRLATAATMIAVTPMSGKSMPKANAAGGGKSGVNITYNVTVNGGGAGAENNFKKILEQHAKEIARVVRNEEAKSKRTDF